MTTLVRLGAGYPHSSYRYSLGCRCLICAAAHLDDLRAAATRRAKRALSTAPHGTAERLRGGCRCQTCRHARKETAL